MVCSRKGCNVKSFTLGDHRIGAKDCFLTTRAAKWATRQVGQSGRTISDVARELKCDWGAINSVVNIYGDALLKADRKRLRDTSAIGFDETGFNKIGEYREKQWATTVCDVQHHQLIEILEGRDFVATAGWLDARPHHFKENLKYGTLDMSDTYAAVFSQIVPKVTQVIDPFHCFKLSLTALDQIRRRIQVEQTGHRGRKYDPLYRVRKLLLMNSQRLDEKMKEKINTLLELGDPTAKIALAYSVKEALRNFYREPNPQVAEELLKSIISHCTKDAMPKELQTLGCTLKKWFKKIISFHVARVSNGPTEALNNLIKRIKRIGFGFTNFHNYRIRALLYAGKPNWRVLDSIVVT